MKLRLRLLQSVLSLFHSQSHALSTRDRVGPTQVGQISISAQRDTSKLASVEVWVSAAPGSRLQEQIAHWNRCISTATITTEVVEFPILRHCDCLHPLRARPCKSWTQSRRFVVFFVGVVVRRAREAVTSYRAQLRESGKFLEDRARCGKGAEKQFSGVARGEQRRGGSETLLTAVNRNSQNEGAW